MSVLDITNQLRACVVDRVRVILEPDDAKELLTYLEAQGYLSVEAVAAMESDGVYLAFLKSKSLTLEQVHTMSGEDAAAYRAEYAKWRTSDDGVKAIEDDANARAQAEADAAKKEAKEGK